MFENTDKENCPITSYKVVSLSNAPLSGDEASIVTLSGSTLTIKYSQPKIIPFLVVAKTSSGQSAESKFNLIIEEIPNTPPKFTKPVESTFKVELVKGVDGELEDDTTLTYTSPKAVDAQ